MPLEPNTKLGPYQIIAPAGAGGMGEVYKAKDTRLDRTVAIKVLPTEFAEREDIKERFEREAKAVSNLNHPNICALYDVGHQDGIDYIVMEFLEGETLAARLEKGPLPLGELLQAAIQIADGLSTAHRQGMVHRDLKPGNIMLTPGGAKLLDFGLAKGIGGSAPTDLTSAPTATSPLTAQGTIIGTYQYMAPEQLEGVQADARSDIFAFGAVLYEMCAGRRPFDGKTQAGLIASIIKEVPRSLSELAPATPPGLQRLVSTCLEKNPEDRRQTMNDVLLDLRWIGEAGSQAGVAVPVSKRRKSRERIAWVLAIAGVAASIIFGALWFQLSNQPRRRTHTSIVSPAESPIQAMGGIALSPDGRSLLFVALDEKQIGHLWLRPLHEPTGRMIPGTAGAVYPFWSPDSRQIGFFAGDKLKRVNAAGGSPRVLTSVTEPRGGSWSAKGDIVYAPNFRSALFRIPAAGGNPRQITEFDQSSNVTSHRWPSFLPDGSHLLFLAQTHEGGSPDDRSQIEVLDLETGKRTKIFQANSSMQYVSSGHILFWSQTTLFAQPFDAGKLSLTGEFFGIVDNVLYTGNEDAIFSASEKGHLAYQGGQGVVGVTRFASFDRTGKKLEDVSEEGRLRSPRFSHDGARLAYERLNDIWVTDLKRGTSTRLTFDPADEFTPIWSPDDRWILYSRSRDQNGQLMKKQASGIGKAEEVIKTPAIVQGLGWISDPESILIRTIDQETGWDLLLYRIGEENPEILVQTPFREGAGDLTLDGEWVLYSSDESGRREVYVQRISDPGGRWQISTSSGWHARWTRNYSEIVFRAPGDRMMAVNVKLGENLQVGIPEELFTADFLPGSASPYDLTDDGQLFIINLKPPLSDIGQISLIQNWLDGVGE
jgi:Tol biopolymer transport system component